MKSLPCKPGSSHRQAQATAQQRQSSSCNSSSCQSILSPSGLLSGTRPFPLQVLENVNGGCFVVCSDRQPRPAQPYVLNNPAKETCRNSQTALQPKSLRQSTSHGRASSLITRVEAAAHPSKQRGLSASCSTLPLATWSERPKVRFNHRREHDLTGIMRLLIYQAHSLFLFIS